MILLAPRSPSTKPLARALLSAAAVLCLAGSVACVPKSSSTNGPTAQSPERQSEAQYDLALDFFTKGDSRRALEFVQKSLKQNPENSKSLFLSSAVYLSFCATDLGFNAPDCHLDVAEKFARAALKQDEGLRDCRNLLGQILILEKKYPDAIAVLKPLTEDAAYSQPHLAWGNLGWAQVLNGNLDAGISSLQNAVTQPKFCVGHYRLGVAYEKKQQFALAEESFTHALDVENSDCQNMQDAWEARGSVRLKLGKEADARTDFERCRAISATSATGKECLKKVAALGGASTRDSIAMPSSPNDLSLAGGVGAPSTRVAGGQP